MRQTTPGRRAGGLRAVLVASLAFAGVAFLPGVAPAATGPATPDAVAGSAAGSMTDPDKIVPGSNVCQHVGRANPGGYRGRQCTAVDEYGSQHLRARGQSYCRIAGTDTIVQCIGIQHIVTIFDSSQGTRETDTFQCGAYGGSSCPLADKFTSFSPIIYRACGHRYTAHVATSIKLPGDAKVVSEILFSPSVIVDC